MTTETKETVQFGLANLLVIIGVIIGLTWSVVGLYQTSSIKHQNNKILNGVLTLAEADKVEIMISGFMLEDNFYLTKLADKIIIKGRQISKDDCVYIKHKISGEKRFETLVSQYESSCKVYWNENQNTNTELLLKI